MFQSLFRSKNRSAILRLFFSNPDREFYIRELARRIDASAGNTQKELMRLGQAGVLKSSQKGNLRFFALNKSHPLFSEMEKIVAKTIGIEFELKKALEGLKHLKFAFIFGSYAKGDLKEDSDIDVFIIGNVAEDDLISRIKQAESRVAREINFHTAKEGEFLENLCQKAFYRDIVKKTILLTDNENEFREFLGRAGKTGKA